MNDDYAPPLTEPLEVIPHHWTQIVGEKITATRISLASSGLSPTLLSDSEEFRAPRQSLFDESDRFVFEREIGRGGMGVVSIVHDRDLRRHVAFKRNFREEHSPNGLTRRFIREAQITAQLSHPNIIPIYDVGALPEGGLYISMPAVHGQTFQGMLRGIGTDERIRRLPELIDIFLKVCDAVAYAHQRGVIHRDIKPENVLVGANGEVRLVDWGLAVAQANGHERSPAVKPEVAQSQSVLVTDPTLTVTGEVMGTPAYMSPEQAKGYLEEVDQRTDVYGLGGLLHAILTGNPPNKGETIVETLEFARGQSRPSVAQRSEWPVPHSLTRICNRALEFHRDERFASVTAMADAVRVARFDHVRGATKRVVIAMIFGVAVCTGSTIGLVASVAHVTNVHWTFWGAIVAPSLGLLLSSAMEALSGGRLAYNERD